MDVLKSSLCFQKLKLQGSKEKVNVLYSEDDCLLGCCDV
jgi:hypothetical protein